MQPPCTDHEETIRIPSQRHEHKPRGHFVLLAPPSGCDPVPETLSRRLAVNELSASHRSFLMPFHPHENIEGKFLQREALAFIGEDYCIFAYREKSVAEMAGHSFRAHCPYHASDKIPYHHPSPLSSMEFSSCSDSEVPTMDILSGDLYALVLSVLPSYRLSVFPHLKKLFHKRDLP